ncbi:MAG TPA: ATP-binding protein [Candidatus Nanoarchaeia archaeon]|nr:ATP-binding protein [Candidatus Nanoarchaeia archaeon]
MKKEGIQNYISLAIKLILALSIINAIQNEYWHIMSTNILLLVLMFTPQIIKKYKVNIPEEFEWVLLIFVIGTLFLGKIGGIIIPIFFGISIGLIGFMILNIVYSSNKVRKNPLFIVLFSFSFAITIGFGLEFLKYYLKILLGQQISLGVYKYSMRIMTYVISGALLSSIIGYLYMKKEIKVFKEISKKFKKINPKILSEEEKKEEIINRIKKGENQKTEFKETLRFNIHTHQIDKKIEFSSLKSITAFLNAEGGTLFLGVSDKGEINGIEKDGFENIDRFELHLTNIIKEKIGKKNLDLIGIENYKINDKTIIKIECKKSNKPVFIKKDSNEESFYIRVGPSNTEIKGSELIEYIQRNFKKIKNT